MTESSSPKPRLTLVVSDMHLGRDCNTITGFTSRRPNPEFDRAFIDLIELYTSGKEADWRVVFAGDFIDFVEVVVRPDAQHPMHLSFEVSDEERSFGLGSESERSTVKLEKTMAYHDAFFRRVAAFVREGGEIVILRGNHDAELYWDKVQTLFRRTLGDMAFEGHRLCVDDAIEVRHAYQQRIRFAPWCYIEPGRLYIEHGHQYDAYCSFDKQLHPISPTNPRRIDTPLFMFAMRYFVNMLTDFNPHNADVWTARDYWIWLRAKGPGGAFYVFRMAGSAVFRALWYAAHFAWGRVGAYALEHNKKLAEEADRYRVSTDKLIQIDNLHYTPVTRNLSELARLLFLDRLLLILGSLAVCLFVLMVMTSVWWELLFIGIIGLTAYQINRMLAPRRFLLPGPKQALAARTIARIMDVPIVVMGHSHARRVVHLGDGRTYFNTGSWLPPSDGEGHVDPSMPCTCKLSHLVIGQREAELRIFCKAAKTVRQADAQSERLTLSEGTAGLPPGADLVVRS